MLHRSFKPAKCKTALKLATSRIKLLKNKREAQVKQLKKELAQLLQSGQDRTAMIRVEHVVREEKTLSAYELIEIYCELIVARLPIIESQKNCPIDLKEAIASVVFASPRCADVPELMDVRKHFTAKYGKDFTSAAVELRPDCGVGRMLIEKLSVKAPDGPAKIKILKSIAEEHNIKWDPSTENDPKLPEDLLNGPSTFEKASQMHMDPQNVQVQPNHDGSGQSMFHVPSSHSEKSDIPANLYDHNRSSAQYSQSSATANMTTNKATVSGTSRPEARPSGNGNEGIEVWHSYSGNGRDFSSGRQNWNMEFKDAAAAAQAAAESADRASMAARAAAELSGHVNISRLNSPGSRGSSAYGLRADLPDRYSSSSYEDHVVKDQVANGRVTRVQNEQIDEAEQDNVAGGVDKRFYNQGNRSVNKSNQQSSMNFQASSFDDDDHMVGSSRTADMYSENNSARPGRSDFTGQMNFDKQSSKAAFESVNEEQNDMKSENIDYPAEVWIGKQSSRSSSRSHSRNVSNDHDVLDSNNDAGENPFAVIDEGSIRSDTQQTSSHDKAPLVFDESGSDDEEEVLGAVGSKGQESMFFSSPGKASPIHLSTNINAWSPRQTLTHPVFSESFTVAPQSDDLLPVTFDDSDDSNSESEKVLQKCKQVGIMEPATSISKHTTFVESESHGKVLSQSSSNDMDCEANSHGKPGMESRTKNQEKFGASDLSSKLNKSQVVLDDDDFDSSRDPVVEGISPAQQLSRPPLVLEEVKDNYQPSRLSDTIRDMELVKESSLESGSELNLGKLTGGLRNKGYKHPPYKRNPSGNAISLKKAVEDTSSRVEQSSSSPSVNSNVGFGASRQEVNEKPSLRDSYARSNYYSDEEIPQQTRSSSQELHDNNMSIEVSQTPSSRSPPTYFGSDNSDSEENLPTQTATSKPRIGTGLSRRTKAYPEHSNKQSPRKATVLSGRQETPDLDGGRIETPTEPHFETKSSFHIGDLDWARKVTEPVSKPIQISNRPSPKERNVAEPVSRPIPDSKPSPQERSEAKPAYKPIPDSKPSPQETSEAKPASKPIPDSKPSPQERSEAKPVSKPIPDSSRPSREQFLKSAASEQPSNSPKILSGTPGSLKTSSSSVAESSSKEKPSHVHPNLPDIDAITAHLQSLRNNRR